MYGAAEAQKEDFIYLFPISGFDLMRLSTLANL